MDFTSSFLENIICGQPLSNKETTTGLTDLVVYPNPTDGTLFIKNENNVPLKVALFNSFGQRLANWENINQIDLSDFQTGLYILQVENSTDNQVGTYKVLIKR